MASTKKKTTTANKGGGSGRSAKGRQPQKRPIRREVGGAVLLVLTLCVLMSYLGISAIFIDWLANVLKGLLGYGYWLSGPALLLAGLVLLRHHGRPVQLRVTCALLLPVFFGAVAHLLLCREDYTPSITILRDLWLSGRGMISGGALSGALAEGFAAVFSPFASAIIFIVVLLVLAMAALRLTPAALLEKHRQRARYQEEPEPERPAAPEPPPRRRGGEPARL